MTTTLRALALVACAAGTAQGAFTYDEAIDGELSGDRFNPTVLAAGEGVNTLSGSVVTGNLDYYTFTVAAGFQLTAVNLTEYESEDPIAFTGIQEGTVFTVDPNAPSPADLLGYALFGTFEVGTDILPLIGTGGGSQGFTGPLGPGDYVFWTQQTGIADTDYTFEYVIEVIPAPASGAVLALGGLMAVRRRR